MRVELHTDGAELECLKVTYQGKKVGSDDAYLLVTISDTKDADLHWFTDIPQLIVLRDEIEKAIGQAARARILGPPQAAPQEDDGVPF